MMKKSFLTLFCLFLMALGVKAEIALSPLAYLNAMTQAQKRANYEQLYLFQEGSNEITTWRYRHINQDNEQFAQLISLDGLREEFLQQGNIVGYFGNSQPFSLPTDKILDNLPSILYTDFNQLEDYDLIEMGKDRIAGRIAQVIRVVPKDEFRYQYHLWIDEQSKLLLKSELRDRNGSVLELFKVQFLELNDELTYLAHTIRSFSFPPLILNQANMLSQQLSWKPKWLPKGFKLCSVGVQHLLNGEVVDSQIYSDGIFSFTLYLTDNQGNPLQEYYWQDGKTTLYTKSIAKQDLVIVGEIPLATARHILQEIELKTPLVGTVR